MNCSSFNSERAIIYLSNNKDLKFSNNFNSVINSLFSNSLKLRLDSALPPYTGPQTKQLTLSMSQDIPQWLMYHDGLTCFDDSSACVLVAEKADSNITLLLY